MKRQKGFALVEMVICIGVLAIVSMFVVRMFVTAANTANRAQDLDIASTIVQTAAEQYKADNGVPAQAWYDAHWNLVPEEDPQGFSLQAEALDNVPHRIRITVRKLSPYLLQDEAKTIFSLEVAASYAALSEGGAS